DAPQDELAHLPLARAQLARELLDLGGRLCAGAARRERLLRAVAQLVERERLEQEAVHAVVEGADRRGGVQRAGDHEHGERGPAAAHLADQVDAGAAGHVHVRDDEVERVGLEPRDRVRDARSLDGDRAPAAHGAGDRVAHRALVVRDEDATAGEDGGGFRSGHGSGVPCRVPEAQPAAAWRGSRIVKRAPPPPASDASIVPPCASTMRLEMARPSPVPVPAGLVVKNGVNRYGRAPRGMLGPLSSTTSSTMSPAARPRTTMRPSRPIACSVFTTRLSSTCWSWFALPHTGGRSGGTSRSTSIRFFRWS